MSQRTDDIGRGEEAHELSNEYLLTLSGFSVAVLIAIFGIEYGVGPSNEFTGLFQLVFAFPWILAAGQTISNGLGAFGGSEPALVTGSQMWGALVPLLTIGVLGPTLFLLFMRSREYRTVPSPVRRVAYLLGLIICSAYFFALIPTTIIASSVEENLRDAQDVQDQKDQIINEIALIGLRMREHSILPVQYGGGGGDARSFSLPAAVRESPYADYLLEWDGDRAAITAVSKTVDGAAVRTTMDERGRISAWTYSGKFE